MAYENANCRIIEPSSTDASEQRGHSWTTQDTIRCSLRQMGLAAEATALGRASVSAFRCRFVSSRSIAVGWRLSIRRDGESDWREYVVRRVAKTHHYDLLVEGV